MKYRRILAALLCLAALSFPFLRVWAQEETEKENVSAQYEEYRGRLGAAEYRTEIAENGFRVVEDQIFPIVMDGFGEVWMIPA